MSRKTAPSAALTPNPSPASGRGELHAAAPVIRLAIAACSAELSSTAPAEFRLLPVGKFKAWDGRPGPDLSWELTPERGAAIVAWAAARASDLVVDYEHQTLESAKNGKPAPAAGWFNALDMREDGLWVTDMRWTAAAKAHIEAGEYRYVSPVFPFDPKTGAVLGLKMAALTNDPGIDGLTELAALSASLLLPTPETSHMDELLEQLRWMLNLPVGSTAQEIMAQLDKLKSQIAAEGADTAAATFDLAKYLADQGAALAALKSATPDPAQYVAVAVLSATQGELSTARAELAALKAAEAGKEVDGIVATALAAGKLLQPQESWARELGKTNLAALKTFVAGAPVVVPQGTQSGGAGVAGAASATDAEMAVCKALGMTIDQFRAGKQEV
jgi:phage I-like protein